MSNFESPRPDCPNVDEPPSLVIPESAASEVQTQVLRRKQAGAVLGEVVSFLLSPLPSKVHEGSSEHFGRAGRRKDLNPPLASYLG